MWTFFLSLSEFWHGLTKIFNPNWHLYVQLLSHYTCMYYLAGTVWTGKLIYTSNFVCSVPSVNFCSVYFEQCFSFFTTQSSTQPYRTVSRTGWQTTVHTPVLSVTPRLPELTATKRNSTLQMLWVAEIQFVSSSWKRVLSFMKKSGAPEQIPKIWHKGLAGFGQSSYNCSINYLVQNRFWSPDVDKTVQKSKNYSKHRQS